MSDTIGAMPGDKVLGMIQDACQKLRHGSITLDEFARFLKRENPFAAVPFTESVSQQQAREIMGRNFLGIEDVQKQFGVQFTPEELDALAEIPFPDDALRVCKDTHVLFAGYPLTILDIRHRSRRKGQKLFCSERDSWYNEQSFACDAKVNLRWYLIRKDVVKNSTSKTYDQQQRLLDDTENVPEANEAIYMVIFYYLVTGIRLFEKLYARCASVTSGGSRVDVGFFDSLGLHVLYYWDGGARDLIGLASSRK